MKENTESHRKGLGKKETNLLSVLSRENKPIFTANDAKSILKTTPYIILHALKKKKWILTLKNGLYAIVPLDIGVKGAESFIVHDFIVASYLAEPYYIGFWTALNYHGLSDQIPMAVFISTTRPKKPLKMLNTEFIFIQVSPGRFFGLETIEIDNREIIISNKEKTIVDCLDHPEHSGGIEEVAKAIYYSHEELDFSKIKEYVVKTGNITIFKRLGYILESTGLFEKYKTVYNGLKMTEGYPPLEKFGTRKGTYNERWKLLVNLEINLDRWKY